MIITTQQQAEALAHLAAVGINRSDATSSIEQIEHRHPAELHWDRWIQHIKIGGGIPDDTAIKIYGTDAARAVIALRNAA